MPKALMPRALIRTPMGSLGIYAKSTYAKGANAKTHGWRVLVIVSVAGQFKY
ncbi:hypothetical protein [Shewanella sp. 30m-9]